MIRVTGFKEVDNVLKGLPAALSDKVFQNAHVRALAPLIDKEHALAPVGKTGNLADSIGIVKASGRSIGTRDLGAVSAGPRRRKPYKGFAGHLVEYGTAVRATKSGAGRGKMPAKPFAGPAWEATKDLVESKINSELAFEVVRFMKRTLKTSA